MSAPSNRPDLAVLLAWFSSTATSKGTLSAHDRGQFLLTAKDLDLYRNHHIKRHLERFVSVPEPAEGPTIQPNLSFLRQVVLAKYDVNATERAQFIQYWLQKEHRSQLDIVARGYLVGLALEQPEFVPPDMQEYVARWHVKNDPRSTRLKAWAPYYLARCGEAELARKRADEVLDAREPNGSWRGGHDATLSIAYALLCSQVVASAQLNKTIEYIARRYNRARTGDDGTDALALKVFRQLEIVDASDITALAETLGTTQRLFISYSSSDRDIVRRLANDLLPWNVWLDQAEIRVGNSIIDRIQEAMTETRYFIVVLSRRSVTSNWVKRELNTALMSSLDDRGIRVLPVVIENCDIPMLLRDTKFADFRTNYQQGLNELIEALD